MDAGDISRLGRFDFIVGSMILHHVEPFEAFARALRQAMEDWGKGFFYENSAASSVLMWFHQHAVGRLGVPKYGDEKEHPLTRMEIEELRQHFRVDIVHPELLFFRLFSTYFLRGRLMAPFECLDTALFKISWFRQCSYRQYLYLSTSGFDADLDWTIPCRRSRETHS